MSYTPAKHSCYVEPESKTAEPSYADSMSSFIEKGFYPFFAPQKFVRSKLAEVQNLPQHELLDEEIANQLSFRQTWVQHWGNTRTVTR